VHSIVFQQGLDQDAADMATSMIDAVLGAIAPGAALKRNFDARRFTRPTHILAFGKASIPMSNAAIECLGTHFARATVLSTPELCARTRFKSHFVELLATDHPIPTQRNIDATKLLIDHARSIPDDHQALVLISGGGSAMLCAPRDGFTLEDIVKTTTTLLTLGAPIEIINAARTELDSLKGGGLAKLLEHTAQADALVLSDVIGNDLLVIASGPAVSPTIQHTIIASNQDAVDALCAWLVHRHIDIAHVQRNAVGFAADQGHQLADRLIDSTERAPIAVCMGGEPTVDAHATTGVGGPMLELALSCAQRLASTPFRWTLLTFTTDGIDGPTDAAGAIITSEMLDDDATVRAIGEALQTHNCLPMCDTLSATIRTGPTGTNVNDIALAIRWAQ